MGVLPTRPGIGPGGPSGGHSRLGLHGPRFDSHSFGLVEGLDVLFNLLHGLEKLLSASEALGRSSELLFHLELDSLGSKLELLSFSLIVQRILKGRREKRARLINPH